MFINGVKNIERITWSYDRSSKKTEVISYVKYLENHKHGVNKPGDEICYVTTVSSLLDYETIAMFEDPSYVNRNISA